MKDELRDSISSCFIRNSSFLALALLALAAFAFGPQPTQAAVMEAWVHRYSNMVSNSVDQAVQVVVDAAGDIIVTGTTDDGFTGVDMLTIKYSGSNGTMLWQKRYNGPANDDDFANAVTVDTSGNVVVTGSSEGDYYTAKYAAADGALLWEQRLNSPGFYDYVNDSAIAVAVDGNGNVLVTGTSYLRFSSSYTAKHAAKDGVLLWEKRSDDTPAALAVDVSGNVVVTGYSQNGTNSDYSTAKYAAADGARLWERRYNGPANGDDLANAVAVDGNGNVAVTGYSVSSGAITKGFTYDYYTAKYAAADGALLWENRYNGPGNPYEQPRAVAVDGNGNVVVTEHSNRGGLASYTAKYGAADGALLWEKRYNGPANSDFYDDAFAVAIDGNGNVVVTGSSFNGTNTDYYTAKYGAAEGALLWEKRSSVAGNSVAVDARGNVVVMGTSYNGYYADYYTAKYAASDGALLWERRYNGLSNFDDSPAAVAVDSGGNVAVTGNSYNGTNNTYYTAKYAAANGALLWERRYTSPNRPEYNESWVQAIAVDSSGNVVVTGSSDVAIANTDYYTAKYAAADGALLWEQHYNGPGNAYDGARAVAVDAHGNVAVTGYSARTGIDTEVTYDYYTAKYAAADGALLWERRVNGPSGRDSQQAIAVDGDGNVVVTGNSQGDYYTAKYAAADGALLWEQRFSRPGFFDIYTGSPVAVAVDGGGNVVVTGNGGGYNSNHYYYYTARYAAADGALLWEKRNNGGGEAVAVDGSGNVIVTGFSYNTNFNTSYSTVKYAAKDGALLWEKPFSVGSLAVAVDGSGNVIVTGYSSDTNFNYDYLTAKYASADGALLWEKSYNGPANGDDTPGRHSLALGPNGMVVVAGSSDGNFSPGTAFDYATVVYREVLPAISIDRVPTGVRIHFTGESGSTYQIERAPSVTGPWNTINTQAAPASGLLEYLDATPPVDAAFYRTREP